MASSSFSASITPSSMLAPSGSDALPDNETVTESTRCNNQVCCEHPLGHDLSCSRFRAAVCVCSPEHVGAKVYPHNLTSSPSRAALGYGSSAGKLQLCSHLLTSRRPSLKRCRRLRASQARRRVTSMGRSPSTSCASHASAARRAARNSSPLRTPICGHGPCFDHRAARVLHAVICMSANPAPRGTTVNGATVRHNSR